MLKTYDWLMIKGRVLETNCVTSGKGLDDPDLLKPRLISSK